MAQSVPDCPVQVHLPRSQSLIGQADHPPGYLSTDGAVNANTIATIGDWMIWRNPPLPPKLRQL